MFNKHTAIGIGEKLWDSFLTISIRKKSDQACQTGVCHLWNVGSTATNSLNGWSYKLLISTGNIALGKKKEKRVFLFQWLNILLASQRFLWQIFCKIRSFFCVQLHSVSSCFRSINFFFHAWTLGISQYALWLHHSDNNSLILTFLIS